MSALATGLSCATNSWTCEKRLFSSTYVSLMQYARVMTLVSFVSWAVSWVMLWQRPSWTSVRRYFEQWLPTTDLPCFACGVILCLWRTVSKFEVTGPFRTSSLLFCNLLLMSFLSLSSFFWRVFSVSFKFLSGTWSYRCWSYVVIPISFSWRCLISWLLVTYIASLLPLFLLTSLAVRKFCSIIVH